MVTNAIDADIVVSNGLADLPDIVCWDLVFSGGRLCTARAFADGRAHGIDFKAAVSVGGRAVWLSWRFQAEHADKCSSLRRAMGAAGSVWAELGRVEWARRAAVCIGQRRPLGAIAVLAESEGDSDALDRNFFTPRSLVDKFSKMASPCLT